LQPLAFVPMQTARRERATVLAVIAVLLLATLWIAVGDRIAVSTRDLGPAPTHANQLERRSGDAVSAVDVNDSAVTPVLAAARTAEPRLAPLWVLPGLAAALAALCLFRRQRLRPTLLARRTLLRGSWVGRAPPLESFA
jgi:hypothetical protein